MVDSLESSFAGASALERQNGNNNFISQELVRKLNFGTHFVEQVKTLC